MQNDLISHSYIRDYIVSLIKEDDPLILEMQEYAKENNVPIVHPETAQFLTVLISMVKPEKILEVGAAIGYSALVMEKASGNMAEILTVEQDFDMVCRAKEFIQKSVCRDKIKIIGGDALEVLPNLNGTYDFIFLDAAKGHYLDFLPDLLRVLRPGGVLVSDNVLYKGMIASKELVLRRKITIVKRLRKYLKEISSNEMLKTSVIPIGDGVSVSYKVE